MNANRSLRRGLARIAGGQVVVVGAFAAWVWATNLRGTASVLAGSAVVLAAMLIGFVPLRLLLRAGPDKIVAAWIAAMMLRMAATLIGLVLLIKRYRLDVALCVWTVCGGYLLLLAVETIGMIRLMRGAFERQRDGDSR